MKKLSVLVAAFAFTLCGCNAQSDYVPQIGLGWNLGNQFDSNNGYNSATESSWGNPVVTEQFFQCLSAAGFNTIRIPITWMGHMGASPTYTIDETWFSRIEEVVTQAIDANLNVIINIHHDGANSQYWLNIKTAANSDSISQCTNAQITAVWTQIANRFEKFDNHLIFEGFNEIHDGDWGWGTNRSDGGKQYAELNEWNQTFVDAVRATGGNNANRFLACPGYCTNPDLTVANWVKPNDSAENRILCAVHFYDPNEYTLTNKYTEWGHTASSDKKESWGDEANVTSTFSKLKNTFVDNNIPCYMGEIGCVRRGNENDEQFRRYYLEYVTKAARNANIPVIIWDNGGTGTGNEQSGMFNRTTGAVVDDYANQIIKAMLKAWNSTDASYTLESIYQKGPHAFSESEYQYNTPVSSVAADATADANAYNLQGQQVSPSAAGIIISNGVKSINLK